MVTRSLVKITGELDCLSYRSLGIKAVTYGLDDCRDFSDTEIRVLESIAHEAPKGAEFYHEMGESVPNRPIGLGIAGQGPLTFTLLVQYYAPKEK